jgi:hypothetical protein
VQAIDDVGKLGVFGGAGGVDDSQKAKFLVVEAFCPIVAN